MIETHFHDPDEALDALRRRTSRVRRIEPREKAFRLRYRSLDLGEVHLSRTWEPAAVFAISGEAIPVAFFPLAGRSLIATRRGEHVCTASAGGAFTVTDPAVVTSESGYSELVVRLDASALEAMLRQLEVERPLEGLLRLASLRTGTPGLQRLRSLALDAFGADGIDGSDPFARLDRANRRDAILLQAADILRRFAPEDGPRPPRPGPRALRLAADYVRAHPGDELTVAAIAQAAGVSVRQLQLLFAREHGCSPMEFVRERRLDHARSLLLGSKVGSVTQAALDSGFGHLGKFAALYAERFGEPPSQTLRRTR